MKLGINGLPIQVGTVVAWPGSSYGGRSCISYGEVLEARENGSILVAVRGSSRSWAPAAKHVIQARELIKVVVLVA